MSDQREFAWIVYRYMRITIFVSARFVRLPAAVPLAALVLCDLNLDCSSPACSLAFDVFVQAYCISANGHRERILSRGSAL